MICFTTGASLRFDVPLSDSHLVDDDLALSIVSNSEITNAKVKAVSPGSRPKGKYTISNECSFACFLQDQSSEMRGSHWQQSHADSSRSIFHEIKF